MRTFLALCLLTLASCTWAATPLYIGRFAGDGTLLSNVTATALSSNTINQASSASILVETNSPVLNTFHLTSAVSNQWKFDSTNAATLAAQRATNGLAFTTTNLVDYVSNILWTFTRSATNGTMIAVTNYVDIVSNILWTFTRDATNGLTGGGISLAQLQSSTNLNAINMTNHVDYVSNFLYQFTVNATNGLVVAANPNAITNHETRAVYFDGSFTATNPAFWEGVTISDGGLNIGAGNFQVEETGEFIAQGTSNNVAGAIGSATATFYGGIISDRSNTFTGPIYSSGTNVHTSTNFFAEAGMTILGVNTQNVQVIHTIWTNTFLYADANGFVGPSNVVSGSTYSNITEGGYIVTNRNLTVNTNLIVHGTITAPTIDGTVYGLDTQLTNANGYSITAEILAAGASFGYSMYPSGTTNSGALAGRTNNWEGWNSVPPTASTNSISPLVSGRYIRNVASTNLFYAVDAGPVSVQAYLYRSGSTSGTLTLHPEFYLYDTVSNTLWYEFSHPPGQTIPSGGGPVLYTWSVSSTRITHTNAMKYVLSWVMDSTPNASAVLNFVSGGSYDSHASFIESVDMIRLNANQIDGTLTNNSTGLTLYSTNTSTMNPDFLLPYSQIETNAAFAFLAPKNVSASRPETAVVLVTNSTAAAVAVTPPANMHAQGTWYVTNVTSFTFFHYANVFSNAIAFPLW